MRKLLVAMFAVAALSVLTTEVAQAGGGGGTRGTIQITNNSRIASITVYYRPETVSIPMKVSEVKSLPKRVIAPGRSEKINGLKEGNYQLLAINSKLARQLNNRSAIPNDNILASAAGGFTTAFVPRKQTVNLFVTDAQNFLGATFGGIVAATVGN